MKTSKLTYKRATRIKNGYGDGSGALSYLLSRVARGATLADSQMYRQRFQFGFPESRIIFELARNPQQSASALGFAADLDKSTVSRSLQTLSQLNYVETTPSSKDGRMRTVQLTAAGLAINVKAMQATITREQQLLSGFSELECHALFGLLKRLELNLK